MRNRLLEEQIKRERCFASRIQHEWTVENDNGRNSKMNIAKDYVANWNDMKKNGLGLLLWGNVGSGKSYMAACVANELIVQGQK
jgi:DNA replication protein DnaC